MQAAGPERLCKGDHQTVITLSEADTDDDGQLSNEELSALTIAQLRALAEEMGITLTQTRKANIIAEILAAQEETEE